MNTLLIVLLTFSLYTGWWYLARERRLSMQTSSRAKQVHELRKGYDKALRMSLLVTEASKAVVWNYIARIEAQAERLNLSDMYPIDPVIQSCIRTLGGPRAVEV